MTNRLKKQFFIAKKQKMILNNIHKTLILDIREKRKSKTLGERGTQDE